VGDFFYRRICGLEALEPGYRRFSVKPLPGGGLTWAECEHRCPYGKIKVRWEKTENAFRLTVSVPLGASAEITMPSGKNYTTGSGDYAFTDMEQ
jgi:alpha-L-rhamnosidase